MFERGLPRSVSAREKAEIRKGSMHAPGASTHGAGARRPCKTAGPAMIAERSMVRKKKQVLGDLLNEEVLRGMNLEEPNGSIDRF